MMAAPLAEMIDRWVEDGVITSTQAQRMRAGVTAPVRRTALVAEGLGYLGGALVAVALGLVAGRYWTELGTVGRPVVLAVAALLLATAGAAVPRAVRGSAARLRAVLWLGACGTVLGLLLLLADDSFGLTDEVGLSSAAAGTLLCAGGFWAAHRHPVLHVTAYLAGLLLAASLVAQLPRPGVLPGLAVWALGVAWALWAWAGLVRPALLGRWLGALATVGGAVAVAGRDWGSVLAVITVGVLVAAAVVIRDTVLLVVAAVGALLILPAVVGLWFPGMLSAAVALLTAGLVLVGAAVLMARRRARPDVGRLAGGDRQRGRLLPAVWSAVAVLVVTVGIVLAAGL